MKYQCSLDATHTFSHPAKVTVNSWTATADLERDTPNSTIETYVCPVCKHVSFSEVVEIKPLETLAVSEWIEAPHSEANAKLKEGYQVYKEYSKTVIMIKPKVEATQP